MSYRDSYEYACQSWEHRFEVVTTFREKPTDEPDETTSGYPEEQPTCPVCHSHEAVRVQITPVRDEAESEPDVSE